MKKGVILLFALLGYFLASAQKDERSIGVLALTHVDFGDYYEPGPNLGYAGGLYYDHMFNRRFGFATGLQFERNSKTIERIIDFPEPGFRIPDKFVISIFYLEAPLNLTYCLNSRSESGFRSILYSGIIFHHPTVYFYEIYYPEGKEQRVEFNNKPELWSNSYFNFGWEGRKKVGSDYKLGLGMNAKFQPAYSLDFSYRERDPIIFNLYLKFGRNL